jgi:uncharacterized protein YqgC (DUF456 family)
VLGLIVGLLGVILPLIPGVGFMWVVVLVYAVAERFSTIDPISFIVLTLLGWTGATTDVWLSLLGAKVGGASFRSTLLSLVGGLLGGLIGLLFAGVGVIAGVWVGSTLGILVNELYEHKQWKRALQATFGMMVGFTLSTVVQLVIGLAVAAIFVWQVLRG